MKNRLPERLRLLRREKGLTQEAMASALQLPRVTYTHYELGKRTPDLDLILNIALFHLVSVDFLLGATWLRPTMENWLAQSARPDSQPTLYPNLESDGNSPAALRFADQADNASRRSGQRTERNTT